MLGLFGTEHQQELQKRTHEMRHWIAGTPGIYNAGRFMGIDDPDRQPWSAMEAMLERDALLALRMISLRQVAHFFPRLQATGCRVDTWDIFIGEPHDAGSQAHAIVAEDLPAGITIRPQLADAESAKTRAVQQFLAASGLAPFPGTMLVARPPLAKTIVLADESGAIAATGHAYFPHNAHSPFCDHAWIGLLAVAGSWRGKGLGRLVNALLVNCAFTELGARFVYEMVSPSNHISRRMVEGSGLRLAPDLRCGVATPANTARFTQWRLASEL
ncbi:GNAT family N-acetyltransferase [Mesorhizobium sp. B2-4-14]|uniref:GNAT family N-acetyltransferase n=1 Tax=Mesorhizobium sp. B2-4-14 TaxID=2589935 RepID=UPI00112651B0|nr:GNAT family N-acetyltransferase [Mesorhizobium sp. B2-4-14]TPL06873.1 GNAT family N-acetyltransferase [Mesorhizobium sp. B2-4-14]